MMVTNDALIALPSFLRDSLAPPRAGQFLAAHPGNLDTEKLSQFLNVVWKDLLQRLESPIAVHETDDLREVVFIGTIKYIVDKRTGIFRSEILGRTENGLAFVEEKAWIAVDPPLRANGGWVEVYLNQWWDAMGEVLIDHKRPGTCWLATVRQIFWKAVRKSTHWKRLRVAMRCALQLDPKILQWSRQGRSRHVNQCVANHQYNRTVAHRNHYEQIERDNPNLVWLYTLMLDERIKLNDEEAIAAMKHYMAGKKVTPAGWRLLANGSERDFRHIRDWIGPDGELTGRLPELPYWLRFLVALRRRSPLPNAIRELFLHDSFNTDREGLVRFRNVWMPVPVVKTIIAEAERRHLGGSLKAFELDDLPEVIGWLESEQPKFDKNQIKAGWKYLASQAVSWKIEREASQQLGNLCWDSSLREFSLSDWSVVPLDDAWKLRAESLRQRHCADRYLKDCLLGNKRLFSVKHRNGRTVATIGIELLGNTWQSFGIKRSCNRPVGPGLSGLDEQVATRYTDLWRLTQPTPPAQPEVIERDDPIYFDSPEESVCPVCGAEEGNCNEHLVACYDVFDGQVVGGGMYSASSELENKVEAILTMAITHEIRQIGLGDALDDLLGSMRQDVAGGESIEDSLCNWSSHTRRQLFDLLLDQTDVICTMTDFDGGMPGCSTTYRNYWAVDTDAASETLTARIEKIETWLQGLSSTERKSDPDGSNLSDGDVLRVHEERLGISVDENDPMLPAVIAMERALMNMARKKQS